MAGVDHEGEMAALREALRQQSLAVEMLKVELEEERHAASSGADEALAMILRLQGEKAAERMEADHFRRVAEERILHDADSLAFLKAVVFSQEMDISSLKNRLLAVCGSNDPYAAASGGYDAVDLPWLRRLARNGVLSGRNASLPAARLEELCSDLGAAGGGEDGDRRPARTVSDTGEVIRMEKEWVRSYVSHQAPPRLHRSASHRLRRVPSYSAQCRVSLPAGSVHDKFEAPESVASHAPPRSSRRSSPEIISEEDELISSATRRGGRDKHRKENAKGDHATIAELGAGIEQIKCSVKNLATELSRMRETSVSRGDAQTQLLSKICAKLDAISKQENGVHGDGDKRNTTSREEGSSSKGVNLPHSELLMNHFIECCRIHRRRRRSTALRRTPPCPLPATLCRRRSTALRRTPPCPLPAALHAVTPGRRLYPCSTPFAQFILFYACSLDPEICGLQFVVFHTEIFTKRKRIQFQGGVGQGGGDQKQRHHRLYVKAVDVFGTIRWGKELTDTVHRYSCVVICTYQVIRTLGAALRSMMRVRCQHLVRGPRRKTMRPGHIEFFSHCDNSCDELFCHDSIYRLIW